MGIEKGGHEKEAVEVADQQNLDCQAEEEDVKGSRDGLEGKVEIGKDEKVKQRRRSRLVEEEGIVF